MLNLCIYANPESTFPIAIINVIPIAIQSLTDKETHLSDLLLQKPIKDQVLKDLIGIGKDSGLKGCELLGDLIFAGEDWTPQNGFLVINMF